MVEVWISKTWLSATSYAALCITNVYDGRFSSRLPSLGLHTVLQFRELKTLTSLVSWFLAVCRGRIARVYVPSLLVVTFLAFYISLHVLISSSCG